MGSAWAMTAGLRAHVPGHASLAAGLHWAPAFCWEAERQTGNVRGRWRDGGREREGRQTDRQTQMESEMVTGKRIERDNKRQRNCERGTKAKNEREQDSERDRHGETETVGAKRDADNRDSERAETVSQTTQQPQRMRQRGTC